MKIQKSTRYFITLFSSICAAELLVDIFHLGLSEKLLSVDEYDESRKRTRNKLICEILEDFLSPFYIMDFTTYY